MHKDKSKKRLEPIKYLLVFLLSAILAPTSLHSQKYGIKHRFGAGISIGLNTTQINGDHLSGYNKFGGFVGFRAVSRFNRTSELVIEIQYNRKGSRDPKQFVPGRGTSRFISLDYIEVPILFHQKIAINSIPFSLEGGLSYARLLGFNINENPGTTRYNTFTDIQNDFNNEDFSLLIGGGVMVNEHVRIMTRFAYSLTLLYENETPIITLPGDLPVINTLRNMQLAIGINYIF